MGKLMEDPVIVEVGKKYGKNGAQVALGMSPQIPQLSHTNINATVFQHGASPKATR
jgi:diketogulonate reductase-like aldo/keto reductase